MAENASSSKPTAVTAVPAATEAVEEPISDKGRIPTEESCMQTPRLLQTETSEQLDEVDEVTLDQLKDKYLHIRRIINISRTDKEYERSRKRIKAILKTHIDGKTPDLFADNAKIFKMCFNGLANLLVLSVNRLDYEVMHMEWLPSYRKVVAAHKTDEPELEILGRIFQICNMSSTEESLVVRPSGIYSKVYR